VEDCPAGDRIRIRVVTLTLIAARDRRTASNLLAKTRASEPQLKHCSSSSFYLHLITLLAVQLVWKAFA
jgi:hypothetical protein